MKRLILCSVLLILIIAGSLLGWYNIHNTKHYLDQKLDSIADVYGNDKNAAQELIGEAIDQWESNIKYMKFYLYRERIMLVSSSLIHIKELIEIDDQQVTAECLTLKKQLDVIYATQLPKLENIF